MENINTTKAYVSKSTINNTIGINLDIKLSESEKELLRKLDMEHRAKLVREKDRDDLDDAELQLISEQQKVTASPNPKSKLKVCANHSIISTVHNNYSLAVRKRQAKKSPILKDWQNGLIWHFGCWVRAWYC